MSCLFVDSLKHDVAAAVVGINHENEGEGLDYGHESLD